MTDKQIITKDVDARGCKFFRNGICASPINPKCKLCVEISEKMCYYKQLKRKEQECFELQMTANAYNPLVKLANYRLDKIEDLQQQLDQLKAENKQYKEAVDNLLKIQYKLADTSNKYNQKLEKIREYCNKYPQNSIGFKKNILQIIDEVEE